MLQHGVFIVAEAGVNHNGSLTRAMEMVSAAAGVGVDAVKFQTFQTKLVVTRWAAKAAYQMLTTDSSESQYAMLQNLELSFDAHQQLAVHCRQLGVEFLSTPFDLTAVELLEKLGQKKWKIPSGEITNLPYLRKIGSMGQPVILSTGMTDLGEIEDALVVISIAGTPWDKITVLHCSTEYPTPMCDVNLRAMQTIANAFPGIRVGYSDHSAGIEVPIAAVAMGATLIEKHFTLDKSLPGPDHKASLDVDELGALVRAIRNVELALGNGIKRPAPSEKKNMSVARRSIVAARAIKVGEFFSEDNLTVKRPGTGISPIHWDSMIGKVASRDYAEDEQIDA